MDIGTQAFSIGVSILCLSLLLFLLLRFKRKKSVFQEEFKWSISYENISLKNKVKHGEGLTTLAQQSIPNLAYLCITQKSVNIIEAMMQWNLGGLKRLYLRDNNIESIDRISMIFMPNLEVLVLSDNKITSIKSLRRLPTPNLIWLEVQNNKLAQNLDALSQMNLTSLHYMWLEFFGNDSKFNDDLAWLSKCQSIILTKFYSYNSKRIVVPKFIQAMRRKYLNFDIKMNNN